MTLKSIRNAGLLISLVLAMLMGFAYSTVYLANDLTSLSSFHQNRLAVHSEKHTSKSATVNTLEENNAPFHHQSSLAELRLVVTGGEHAHRL
jgi:hypothetical protein